MPCYATLAEDTPASIDLSSVLTVTGVLSSSIIVTPTHGSASISNTLITYTPAENYFGSDQLRYQLETSTASYQGSVHLTVSPINDAPTVSINVTPITGTAPLSVHFEAIGDDIEHDSLTYVWDFGDLSPLTQQAVVDHIYTVSGSYTATVTVSDSHGDHGSASQVITVSDASGSNHAPVALLHVHPAQGPAPLTSTLELSASDPDSDPLTYTLDFGDNSASSNGPLTSPLTLTHTYASNGSYIATLSVIDGRGGSDTISQTINVTSTPPLNTPPVLTWQVAPLSGAAPLTVSGSLSASDVDNDPLTYTLDFGDSTQSSGVLSGSLPFAHTYTLSGTYALHVSVGDGHGGSDSDSVSITVSAPGPVNHLPQLTLHATPNAGPAPLTTSISLQASDPDGDSPLTYTLNFGDGSAPLVASASNPISTTVAHTYASSGQYTLQLSVNDGHGSASTTTTVVAQAAGNHAPVAYRVTLPLQSTQASVDLLSFIGDADADPLTLSLASQPLHGVASISGTTLTYTRTGSYSGFDSFDYRVADGRGGSASAEVRVVDQRLRLQINPDAVVLSGSNATRTLTLQAFDQSGRPVDTSGLDVEWVVIAADTLTDTTALTLTALPNAQAELRSLAPVGAALVGARLRSAPDVQSPLINAVVVELESNTTPLPDAQVIYPPLNPPANSDPLAIYPIIGDHMVIGDFSEADVLPLYSVTGGISATFPIVVTGAGPDVGTIVIGSGGSQILGRVVQRQQRASSTLLQLQAVPLHQAFRNLDLRITDGRISAAGWQQSRPISAAVQLENSSAGSELKLVDPLANTSATIGSCTANVQGQWGRITLGQVLLTPNQQVDLSLQIRNGVPVVGRFYAGAAPTWHWNTSDLQATGLGSQSFACTAAALPSSTLLPLAVPNFFHATPGAQIAINLGLTGQMTVTGTPDLRLVLPPSDNTARFGSGFDFNPLVVTDQTTWTATLAEVAPSADLGVIPAGSRARMDQQLGLSFSGSVQMEQWSGLFAVLNNPGAVGARFPQISERYSALRSAASGNTLSTQASQTWRTRWAAPDEVVWSNLLEPDARKFSPTATLTLQQSAQIDQAQLRRMVQWLGGPAGATFTAPPAKSAQRSFYGSASNTQIQFRLNDVPTTEVWVNDEVQVSARFSDTAGRPLSKATLYYIDDEQIDIHITPVASLVRENDLLVGSFTPDAAMCSRPDKELTFHLIGSSSAYDDLETAAYIGQIQVACNELKLELELPTGLANAQSFDINGNPIIWACETEQDPLDLLTLAAAAQASDSRGQLRELEFAFGDEHQLLSVLSPTAQIQLEHSVSSATSGSQTLWAEARAGTPDANGHYPRVRRIDMPFVVRYRSCDEVQRRDTRTRETLCERVLEENIVSGHWEYPDPDSSVGVIVWESATGWHAYERISKNTCYWKVKNDPHISTMDGRRFESFSLGEFVYLEPLPGFEGTGITVQARQESITRTSELAGETLETAEWAAWNTAFAIQADGNIFEFRAGALNRPYLNHIQLAQLQPGVYPFGDVDLKVNSPTSVELSYGYTRLRIDSMFGKWVNLEAIVPQDDSVHGMMGRPNGRYDDEDLLRDGTHAFDDFDLANSWRITDTVQSLFTYAPGTSPATYNRRQIAEPPSRSELAPYMDQAQTLLDNVCDTSNVDEIELRNVAIELFLGRSPEEIIATGVCFVTVTGTVWNQLVPGLPVPGAKIDVTSTELAPCSTWTDRFGRYACRVPSNGRTGQLTVRVSGRGSATKNLSVDSLPPAGGQSTLVQDMTVAPTTLQLVGQVRDQTGEALYNAELRISGPTVGGFTTSYTTTSATGMYTSYMMLNDGVISGTNTYRLLFNPEFRTDPDAQMVRTTIQRQFSNMNPNALNVVREDLTLTGVLLQFKGRVSFLFDDSKPAPGTRVIIEPVLPHPEFNSCDVTTLIYVDPQALVDEFGNEIRKLDPRKETTDRLKEGTYFCEETIETLDPFDVKIQLVGRNPTTILTSTTVTVDPRARGAGEPFRVITPLRLETPVLHLSGFVRDPDGNPVSAAEVTVSSPEGIAEIKASTNITGEYSMYLPLDDNINSGSLQYNVRYINVTTGGSFNFAGAVVGLPLEVQHDFTVRGSMLIFAGRVIDTRINQPVPGVAVKIESPGLGVLCQTFTGIDEFRPDAYLEPGLYPHECRAEVDPVGPGTIDLIYTVTTAWGTTMYTHTAALAPLGGRRYVPRDLEIRTTILELNGVVTRPSGNPLPEASMTIRAAGRTISTRTKPDGTYNTAIILPYGVTTGTLEYTLSYRQIAITDTATFDAVPFEATTVTRDMIYTPRTVYLRGTVSNIYHVDTPLTNIQIQSDGLITTSGMRCVTQTALDGTYVCVGQTRSTAPISISYSMSGEWGSQAFTETATIDGSQDVVEHVRDLQLQLTAIHAFGRVQTPQGDPLGNVDVVISGNDVYRIAPGKTNASGDYDFYVIMKPRTAQWTGTLNYFIGYGEEGRINNVEYLARLNQETPLTRDFILDMRVVTFSGSVKNGFVNPSHPDSGVYGTRVVVTAPSIGYLCEYATQDRYLKTTYQCDARVFTDQPFEVQYALSGNWGSAVLTGTVTHLPGPGQRVTVARNLTVFPTTVEMSGRIVDRDSQPLKDVKLTLAGDAFLPHYVNGTLEHLINTKTSATGYYTTYAVLGTEWTGTDLDYQVVYTFGDQSYTLTRTDTLVTPRNELTSVRADFQYPYRRVTFSGRLRNETAPQHRLKGTLLLVSPTLNRTLCRMPNQNNSQYISTEEDYRCDALVDTDAPFLVNYRVEGRFCQGSAPCPGMTNPNHPLRITGESTWGEVRFNNIEAAAGTHEVRQDIPAHPRMLILNGTVSASDGTPLPGASVSMKSYTIVSDGYVTTAASTNGSGTYSTTVILGADVTNVNIHYNITVNGITTVEEASFILDRDSIINYATHDLEISARNLIFRGSMVNTLTGGSGTWSRNNQLVISSPTLGNICISNDVSASYQCAVQLADGTPFDVSYTLYADWGTSTYTDHVDTLPDPGRIGYWDKQLPVTPTMLRVRGTALLDDEGFVAPISNRSVTTSYPRVASSPMVSSQWQSSSTNADGDFEVLAVLRDLNGTLTGTLSLVFAVGGTPLAYVAHFNNINELQMNDLDVGTITLVKPHVDPSTARTIILRGNFLNAHAPTVPAANTVAWYSLTSPTHGMICYYDENIGPPLGEYGLVMGSYNCTVRQDSDEPFEVTVNAWGPHGNAERVFEVTDIPMIGQSRTIFEDVQLTPTTFHLGGVVTQPGGYPVGRAQVQTRIRYNGQIIGSASDTADQNGIYETYINISPWLQGQVDIEYVITVDGIVTEYRLPSRSFRPAELNEFWQNWPFERRRVRFVGRVTNAHVPGLGVPGLMYVTSPDFWSSQYCDAEMNLNTGYYTCDAFLDDGSPFDVNYHISGEWGASDATGTITNVLGVGLTTLVERDFTVSPTTLHLFGTVTDPYGKRLAGADVTIFGDFVGYSGPQGLKGFTVRADAQGNYDAYVVLKPNVTQGDMKFDIKYYNIHQQSTRRFFGLTRNALNHDRQDFEISYRKAVFVGRARNAFAPGLSMLGEIGVSTPDRGELCHVNIDDGSGHQYNPEVYLGEYTCIAPGVSVEPFTVTYTLNGDWGTAVYTDDVPFGAVGSAITVTNNFPIAATTLRLVGTVRDGFGAPLPGADITVNGAQMSASMPPTTFSTNAQGVYSGTVVLKANTNAGSLTYNISYGDGHGVALVPFTAQADVLNTVTRDITFTERIVNVSGIVGNALSGNMPLRNARVQLSDSGGGELCNAYTNSSGQYSCSIHVVELGALPIQMQVSGDWGSASTSGEIPAGGAGTTSNVNLPINISPTTLRVIGHVEDGQGQVLPNASVHINSPALSAATPNWTFDTDAQGFYSGTVVLKTGMTSGDLSYGVTYNNATGTLSGPFNAQANALTTVTRTLRFTTRSVRFNGQIVNHFAPYQLMSSSVIEVDLAGGGRLCRVTSNSSAGFTCQGQVLESGEVPVQYLIQGDWGTTILTGTIPAGGAGTTTDITRTLEAQPTTILARGIVRGGNDAPLQGATISVSSAQLSANAKHQPLTTDAQGGYNGPLVLRAGLTSADLSYLVRYGQAEATIARSISVTPSVATPIVQDVRFTNRAVVWNGSVGNSLIPGATMRSPSISITSGAATLCSSSGTTSGTYSCRASVENTGAFSSTVTASGDWGSVSAPALVAAGTFGSLITVTQALSATPTMLRLTGQVRGGGGAPIGGATVSVSGASLSASNGSLVFTSDAQGHYTGTVLLKSGTTSGQLLYSVSYGAGSSSVDVPFSATANTITTVNQDISFTSRSVSVAGQVVNRHTYLGLRSTNVNLQLPSGAAFCSRTTTSSGNFTCAQQVSEGGAFVITATVSADWGTRVVTFSVPPGDTGSTANVNPTLLVDPTTLLLTGTARDGNSTPLGGASITIDSDLVSSASNPLAMTTNAQGVYSGTVVLKDNITSGSLPYLLSYQASTASDTVAFSATPRQVTSVSHDLTLQSRTVTFNGYVVASVLPSLRIQGAQVIIRSTELGRFCSLTSNSSGYSCSAQVFNPDAFETIYEISGDWGTTTLTGTVGAGTAGSNTTVSSNLPVTATTVQLTGRVQDAQGGGINAATVRVDATPFSSPGWVQATTNASGQYTMAITLKSGQSSGTLNYTVTANGTNTSASQSFSATPNALTTVSKDITITTRQVSFYGYVRNALVSGMNLYTNQVRVEAPGLGTLCTTNNYSTYYSCSATVGTTAAFSATYTLSGDWGTAVVTQTIPASSGAYNASRDLSISPTTLHVTGYVQDSANNRLSGAGVTLSGSSLSYSNVRSGTSAADGTFNVYAVLDSGVLTGNVSLDTTLSSTINQTVPFTATANALTTLTRTVVFDRRTVYFRGYLYNEFAPTWPVRSRTVTVRDQQGTQLCQDSYLNSTYGYYYNCSGPVLSTDAFSATYEIVGPWGTTVVSQTVPAGAPGSTIYFDKNLLLRPTTLDFAGQVVDRDGTALSGVSVSVNGGNLDSYNIQSVTSDASGNYHLYALPRADVTSGSFNYSFSRNGMNLSQSGSFSATPNELTTLTSTLMFDRRRVDLSGTLRNSYATTQTLPISTIQVRANGSTLCNYSPNSSAYTCNNMVITPTSAISATYTVSGPWGSEVITDTWPADIGASRISVARDLLVHPTTVQLTGTVTNYDGSPLADAYVEVSSPALLTPLAGYVDAQGRYSFYGAVQANTSDITLAYSVQANGTTLEETLTRTLNLRQLNPIGHDLTIRRRTLFLRGEVHNALTSTPLRDGGRTTLIISDTSRQLCATTTIQFFGTYACSTEITPTAELTPFDVTYQLSGAWGTHTYTATLDPATLIDNTFNQTLAITPTTLRISGMVQNASAAPLLGTYVDVRATSLHSGAGSYTNDSGNYSLDLIVADATDALTVTLLVGGIQRTLPISGMVASTLNTRTLNITSAGTTNRTIDTVAGGVCCSYNDGALATQAYLGNIYDVVAAPNGGFYIADTDYYRVRYVNQNGIITTVAGNGSYGYSGDDVPATSTRLSSIRGLALGADGSLYIADTNNHRIRRVSPDGIITTVAGNGTGGYDGDGALATTARLSSPADVAVGPDGSLYIADTNNHRIRRVSPDGIITTVAGNGTAGYAGDNGSATGARLYSPYGVQVGIDGALYIADLNNRRIRRVSSAGIITTIAGTGTYGYSGDGGPATNARFGSPVDLAVGADGSIYVVDTDYHVVRRISTSGYISTLAGTGSASYTGDGGPATSANLYYPYGLGIAADGALYIADRSNARVRRLAAPELTLSGRIVDADGTGLNNVSMSINGALLNHSYSINSNAQGDFTLYGQRVDRSSQSATLTLQATYGPAQVTKTVSASVDYVQPQWLTVPITIDQRGLQVSGSISNTLIGQPLTGPANSVSVSIAGAEICTTQTDASGQYNCPQVLTTSRALSVTTVVSGTWGTAVLTSAVDRSAVGGVTTLTQAIPATPTTLHIGGFVRNPDGTPVSGLQVRAEGLSSYSSSSGVTDSNGEYGLDVVLQAGISSGNIRLRVQGSGLNIESTLPFSNVPLNQLTTISHDIGALVLRGSIFVASQPSLRLHDTSAQVSVAANGVQLCSAAVFARYGTYDCPGITLTQTLPLTLEYTVSGAWGQQTINVPLTSTAAPLIVHDLAISPTVLRMTGQVQNSGGSAQPSYPVAAYGPALVEPVTGFSNSTGTYTLYALLRSSALTGSLDLIAGGEPTPLTLSGITAGAVNTLTTTLTINAGPELVIDTLAGTGSSGSGGDGGPASQAQLGYVRGASVDQAGNLYFADNATRVRRIAPDGTISTIAGSANYGYSGDGGPATAAELNTPTDVVVGPEGSLYIADAGNRRIRRITPDGIITTFAGTGSYGYSGDGGPATAAQLASMEGLAIGPDGSLYIADSDYGRIRRITPDGIITTFAGTGSYSYSGDGGPATAAAFRSPADVAVGPDGSVYIADRYNQRIRRVAPNGIISTVAGTGSAGFGGDGGLATSAYLYYPQAVAVDDAGNLYIGDGNNRRVRRVSSVGIITTIAGTGSGGYSGDGGPARNARIYTTNALLIDYSGALIVSDSDNYRLRRVGYPLLSIQGSTVDPRSNPVPYTNVTVQGAALARSYSTTSDNTSSYRVYPWVTPPLSGTIDLYASQGVASTSAQITVSADLTRATVISTALELDGRSVDFYGSIVNSITYDQVPNVPVSITLRVDGQEQCSTYTEDGSYYCGNIILPSAAATLEYEYSGEWGSNIITDTLPEGQVGQYTSYSVDLPITLTTLRLVGTVRSATSTPISSTVIEASGPTLLPSAGTSNADDGSYQLDLNLLPGYTSGTLTYTAYQRTGQFSGTLSFSDLTANAVNTQTLDLAALGFQGQVRNALLPEHSLSDSGRTSIAIAVNGSPWCTTSTTGAFGSFNCDPRTTTPGGQLNLTYTLSGTWGTAVQTHTLASLSDVAVQHDLSISPTTVVLSGSVQLADGTPVAGHMVNLYGPALYQVYPGISASDGTYRSVAILNSGVSSTTLSVAVNGSSTDLALTGLQLSALNTVTHDISVTSELPLLINTLIDGSQNAGPQLPLYNPVDVTAGSNGSHYIVDRNQNIVLRHNANGTLDVVAGMQNNSGYNGDGITATAALLSNPMAVAVGPDGSLYIADSGNRRIRRVGPDGIISTVAGSGNYGTSYSGDRATQTQFQWLTDIAFGPDGLLYFADGDNNQIGRIGGGLIDIVVAGSGGGGSLSRPQLTSIPAVEANLAYPSSIAFGGDGSLYVTSSYNNQVLRITPSGSVTVVAGNGSYGSAGDGGPAVDATLSNPQGLALSPDGSFYIADTDSNRIRFVGRNGIISTVVGSSYGYSGDGGPASAAQISYPRGLLLTDQGALIFADSDNRRVRRIAAPTLRISGVVRTPEATPVNAARVTASSAAFSTVLQDRTDAAGFYELLAINPLSSAVSTTIELTALSRGVTSTTAISVVLQPGVFQDFSVPLTLAVQPLTTTHVSYSGPVVAIPDSNASGADATIEVSGLSGTIGDIEFSIDGSDCNTNTGSTSVGLDHTYDGDLTLTLISPAGTHVTLSANRGGGGNNFCQTVFDDQAEQLISSGSAPFTGLFQPDSPLEALNGEDPNGTWTFHVVDGAGADIGSIRAFSIHISTPIQQP